MWTHRRSGLTNQRGLNDKRTPYERDKTRIIHCPAFRRLQSKTQILGTKGDFHRTRLTRSLEVASIGTSINRHLQQKTDSGLNAILPDDDLMQSIGLLHDIGHPPFGHGGEVSLNYMMREHSGFESNAQALRLLTKLEQSYGDFGLDLTRRTLLGLLKYPVPRSKVLTLSIGNSTRINDWLPPKCYFDSEEALVMWLLEPLPEDDARLFQSLVKTPTESSYGVAAFCSLDCSIMNIADDIAYGVHDLEDAIHLNLIHPREIANNEFLQIINACNANLMLDRLFSEEITLRKQAIGELVNYFVNSVLLKVTNAAFANPLLKYNACLPFEAQTLLNYLKQCVYNHVINSHEARLYEHGGQTIVANLFTAIHSNPLQLLDNNYRKKYSLANCESDAHRVICDFIANMTDTSAEQMHAKLYGHQQRNMTLGEK